MEQPLICELIKKKIEANANRYILVWKKSTEKSYRNRDLEELGEESTITAEKVEQAKSQLEEKLVARSGNNVHTGRSASPRFG